MDNSASIVEIIGPAGSGKTTLIARLSQRNSSIQPIYRLRQPKHITYYFVSALLSIPYFLCQSILGERYTRREINKMLRLRASCQILERYALRYNKVIVVDQGPIYTLATLPDDEIESSKDGCSQGWWRDRITEMAETLDLVIWLDAPDEVLLDRIYNRSKEHVLKEVSRQDGEQLLTADRNAFAKTVSRLTAQGGPRYVRFDTSRISLDRIVENTLAMISVERQTN